MTPKKAIPSSPHLVKDVGSLRETGHMQDIMELLGRVASTGKFKSGGLTRNR